MNVIVGLAVGGVIGYLYFSKLQNLPPWKQIIALEKSVIPSQAPVNVQEALSGGASTPPDDSAMNVEEALSGGF